MRRGIILVGAALTAAAALSPQRLDARLFRLNKSLIDGVKGAIDVAYADKDYARFYVLETVARVPYFAYLSVMHLRETFGDRDPSLGERMRTHYAEADNELHHLLIMEALGGNSSFVDRAVAQTAAFFYYWYVVGVFALSEQAAYHLSELIEDHAYDTYDAFLAKEEARLKILPVPPVARDYYEAEDNFFFQQFCTVNSKQKRRPKLDNLYDVFVNVRDDEKEHWKTLCTLVQFNALDNPAGASNVQRTVAAAV